MKKNIELLNPKYADAFVKLSEIEKGIIIAVNYQGKSWKELAEHFNYNRRYVIKVYERALSKLGQ